MKKLFPLLLSGVLVALNRDFVALAHGANIKVSPAQVEIRAAYDAGGPMAQAQVVVYSPENPTEPWMQGITDEDGRFAFTPDFSQPGNWEVTVRQAGHGDVAIIPIGAVVPVTPNVAQAQAASLSPMQRWGMMAAIVWGFVGTALFFSRGKH